MAKEKTRKELVEEELEEKEGKELKDLEGAEESGKRLSGEPDSNLAAIGGGGIAGAAAGAAIGTALGGPVGGVVGAAAGAVAGGATADVVADKFDPNIEEAYWKEHYKTRPYYKEGEQYDNYLPAYRFGWECAVDKKYSNRDFTDIEADLESEWQKQQSASKNWSEAKPVVREAFIRVRELHFKK